MRIVVSRSAACQGREVVPVFVKTAVYKAMDMKVKDVNLER